MPQNSPTLPELYQEEAKRLRRLAAALLADEAAADDVVQEVWIQSLHHRPSDFRDPRAWLMAVTKHIAHSHGRSSRARAYHESVSLEAHTAPDVVSEISVGSLRESLRGAVEALAEPVRSAVHLRYLEELSVDEVSARLDRPRETVRSQLKKGLELLRQRLDGEYGARRAWSLGLIAAYDWERDELREAGLALGAAGASAAVAFLTSVKGVATVGALVALGAAGSWWRSAPGALPRGAGGTAAASLAPDADPVDVVLSAPEPEARLAVGPGAQGSAVEAPLEATATEAAAARRTLLRVTVVDHLGRPVPEAQVGVLDAEQRSSEARGRTDALGELELDVTDDWRPILAGSGSGSQVTLCASRAGYADSMQLIVRADQPKSRAAQLTLPGPGLRAHGRIQDAAGEPIAGATVIACDLLWGYPRQTPIEGGDWVRQAYRYTVSDAHGEYAIEGLQSGSVQVVAVHDRYAIGGGEARPADGAADAEIDVLLDRGVRVSGVVVDEDGRPLPGVLVDVRREGIERCRPEVATDAEGRFVREDMPPADGVELWALAPDGRAALAVLDLVDSQPEDLVLRVSLEHRLEVHLHDSAGMPHANTVIGVFGPNAMSSRQVTDAQGVLRMPDAPPGPLQIEVIDPQRRVALPVLIETVTAGPTVHDLVLDLPSELIPGSASGLLRKGDGSTPTGLLLSSSREGSRASAPVQLDAATGEIRAELLPTGATYLAAFSPTMGTAILTRFEARLGSEVDLGTLVLEQGSIVFELDFPPGQEFLGPHATGLTLLGMASEPIVGTLAVIPPEERHAEFALFPGLYWILVRPEDGPPVSRAARVYPDAVTHLTVSADPVVHLGVVASLPGGLEPSEPARVTVRSTDGDQVLEMDLVRGRGTFRVPLGGRYLVSVTSGDLRATGEIEPTESDLRYPREVTLTLE